MSSDPGLATRSEYKTSVLPVTGKAGKPISDRGLMSAICVIAGAGFTWIDPTRIIGIAGAAFALAMLVLTVRIEARRPRTVTVTTDGIEWKGWARSGRLRWDEISAIAIGSVAEETTSRSIGRAVAGSVGAAIASEMFDSSGACGKWSDPVDLHLNRLGWGEPGRSPDIRLVGADGALLIRFSDGFPWLLARAALTAALDRGVRWL